METRLREPLLKEVEESSVEEAIAACIQCGTCTASCPVSHAMEYKPRQLVAALRAGRWEEVLRSNSPWLCASCYYCTVRCPSGIEFTELMYDLRRLGVRYGLATERDGMPVMEHIIWEVLNRYGRSHELELLLRYYLRKDPLGLVKVAPLGIRLFLNRRVRLWPERVAGQEELRKMLGYLGRGKGEG